MEITAYYGGGIEALVDGSQLIIARDGLYEAYKSDLFTVIRWIGDVNLLDLDRSVQSFGFSECFIYHLPLLPPEPIADFIALARRKISSEVAMEIFWDLREQSYKFVLPVQKVSSGSVDYKPAVLPGCIRIGDIHSHNTMGSFFSSVDDSDDSKTTGFHFVVSFPSNSGPSVISGPGWRCTCDFELKARFTDQGYSIKIEPGSLFERPIIEPDAPSEEILKEYKEKVQFPAAYSGSGKVYYSANGQAPHPGYWDKYSTRSDPYLSGVRGWDFDRETDYDIDKWYVLDDSDVEWDDMSYKAEKDSTKANASDSKPRKKSRGKKKAK